MRDPITCFTVISKLMANLALCAMLLHSPLAAYYTPLLNSACSLAILVPLPP